MHKGGGLRKQGVDFVKGSKRERILSAKDIKSERVIVPEWDDVEIEIRGLTAAERADLLEQVVDSKGKVGLSKLSGSLLVITVFDPETGNRIFSGDDAQNILLKSGAVVDRLNLIAMRLSGLSAGGLDVETKN